MAHPEPSARSAEQIAEERAMAEVSDVLASDDAVKALEGPARGCSRTPTSPATSSG